LASAPISASVACVLVGFQLTTIVVSAIRKPLTMTCELLVRYGAIPEIGRFACAGETVPTRGTSVVVQTLRGRELGTVLESARPVPPPASRFDAPDEHPPSEQELSSQRVLHVASREDLEHAAMLRTEAQRAFADWQRRMAGWNLQLDLIDLEWTLDRQKLLLYVLGGRGPETTRLALLAAAAGLSVVDVQPVGPEGIVAEPKKSGGCGSGGCGCSH